MLRVTAARHHRDWPGFRLRGEEVTRLEGFSDAVFGFAVTLLVVSLEVPHTFAGLLSAMRGFVAFGVCFTMLLLVWSWHYRYFRRYGLQDEFTLWLNAGLLFVVLFYIYPLKFLFTTVTNELFGFDSTGAAGGSPPIAEQEWPTLMIIYGLGFLAIIAVFVLLYFHAYRKRADLRLNALEVFDTRSVISSFLLMGSVPLLSILVVAVGGAAYSSWSGLTYMLIAPLMTIHGTLYGRTRRRVAADLQAGRPAARLG